MADFELRQRKLNKAILSRRAGEYLQVNPGLRDIFKFYRDIFATQKKISQKIPDSLPHLPPGQISWRLQEGQPLIGLLELDIDLPVLREMMRGLGDILKARGSGETEGLDALLEKLADDGELASLVDSFWRCRDEGGLDGLRADGVSPQLLYMLMHISLAPFLWKRSAALARKADLDEVPQGRCPVCGDLPVMGLMNEEGLRILECSLCGTRWVFPRMMCPFCNNTDQGMLSYIFVEGDRSRRAYLCDACKRYIKVSEAGAGRLEEKVMALEDLATAHLDQAAEQRGYERGCRTAFC